ncbi:MAG TPA: hydantoinase/oxoprolinase family protein [Gammaproteobacteria bacterium]|nr:hydantoinase/oxoprolinase family protein [Gammaproteobacteria bacterium]
MHESVTCFAGWDIGGAHLKLAVADTQGRLLHVGQYPCRLWRGLHELDSLLSRLCQRWRLRGGLHGLTMTGELADVFADRGEGVQTLLRMVVQHIDAKRMQVYSLHRGLCDARNARRAHAEVASANWHATAASVAKIMPQALLVDIGSTTTDIIPIRNGRVAARGLTDAGRLRTGELVYTGVARTPIMAVARRVRFHGAWQGLAAEHFAGMADVYRLTGDLRYDGDETADRRGKNPRDCARRLARMLGCDLRNASMKDWRRVARHIAGIQQDDIAREMKRVMSQSSRLSKLPVVGAGVGRFIAKRLARRMGHTYIDYAELMDIPRRWRVHAAVCAPAVALAMLRQASC